MIAPGYLGCTINTVGIAGNRMNSRCPVKRQGQGQGKFGIWPANAIARSGDGQIPHLKAAGSGRRWEPYPIAGAGPR